MMRVQSSYLPGFNNNFYDKEEITRAKPELISYNSVFQSVE